MNSSSIYDAALSQLHLNYQTLQETVINMTREQSKIFESVTRIQNDFECYKDSQNDRLDEILTNIDSDIKRVSQEAQKSSFQFENKLSEILRDSVSQKQVDTVKSDLLELKSELDESRNKKESPDMVELTTKIERSQSEFSSFKAETNQKMQQLVLDASKISTSVENSCISKGRLHLILLPDSHTKPCSKRDILIFPP